MKAALVSLAAFAATRARRHAPLLLIAALACAWGLAVMSRYGVTFDSPALFYAGDRTRFALAHPAEHDALDFGAPEPPGVHHDTEMITPMSDTNDPKHYPVLPALLCSYTDALFHVKLKWLNGIDGHHIGLVFLHAFALLWFGLYATRVLGRNAALLATVILATFPSALGHSFNNPKDWPCAELYGVAVLAAATGILEQRARPLLAAGVWLGLALSAKFNAVFVLVTIVAWTPIAYLALYRPRTVHERVVGAYLVAPWVAFALFFKAWPWLTHGKYINEWWHALSDYLTFMVDYGVIKERTEWSTYPWRCLFYMTPPIVLACAAVFAAVGWRKTRRDFAVWALLLLWAGLPLVRCSAPHANFYDANRHFIEYVPGLAAMAGAGAWRIVELGKALLGRFRAAPGVRIAVAVAGAGVLAVGLVLPIAAYHPYETAYFNVFIGGLGGAQRKGLLHDDNWRASQSEDDYWYSALRGGLARMTKMAGHDEKIGVESPPYTPQLYADMEDRAKLDMKDPAANAALLYVGPSPGKNWKRIHELEAARPVRYREVRGGGLIYEVLGKADGQKHALVSPHTRYDDDQP